MKIEYFDNGLINIPFKEGYRITFNSSEPIDELVNFLSDNIGEGIVDNNVDKLLIEHDEWILFKKNNKTYILVMKHLDDVNKLQTFLNSNQTIDYHSCSSFNKLKNELQRFIFEPITTKNKNRIREIIRKQLYIKPYDFNLILNEKGIQIILNN